MPMKVKTAGAATAVLPHISSELLEQSHPENKLAISANEYCCGCLSLGCGVCPFRIVKTSPSPGPTDLRTVVQIRNSQSNPRPQIPNSNTSPRKKLYV